MAKHAGYGQPSQIYNFMPKIEATDTLEQLKNGGQPTDKAVV
jgi:hypothetical protein